MYLTGSPTCLNDRHRLSILLLCLKTLISFLSIERDRERECMHAQAGEGQTERMRENPQEGPALSAQIPM